MSAIGIKGHPLHAALVALPIGLYIWTLTCSLIFLASDEAMWYDFAFWTGLAAIASALVAALPGFVDYLRIRMGNAARTVATIHMVANLIVVAMFSVATVLMLDDAARGGTEQAAVIGLQAAGVAVLTLAGWLGGEMVHVMGLTVAEEPGADLSGRRPAPTGGYGSDIPRRRQPSS